MASHWNQRFTIALQRGFAEDWRRLWRSEHRGRWLALGMAVAALGFLAWFWRMSALDARVFFLSHHGPAEWVMYPKPPSGILYRSAQWDTEFRKSFTLVNVPATAKLSVRAMDHFAVSVNGQTVNLSPMWGHTWKDATELEVSPQLRPGTNEISITVFNDKGPPVLWADLQAGDTRMVTGADWDASLLGAKWCKVRLAGVPPDFAPGDALAGGERPWDALRDHWLFYLMLGVFSASLLFRGKDLLARYQARGEPWGPVTSRKFAMWAVGIVAILWAVLFLNNAGQLPYVMGFDSVNHLEYINYIKMHWRLPLASEGWQMYQPPLYHIIGALLTAPIQPSGFSPGAIAVLHLFGGAIGIAQFTLVFLGVRLLFPERIGLQLFGLVLAAALPENIYISHYITNEALCAMLSTASIYLCLRILKSDGERLRQYVLLGVCLGAALLTKITAVVIVPFIGAAILGKLIAKKQTGVRMLARTVGLVAVLALAIGGWHYLRMWRQQGNPLAGNWDGTMGFNWWMEDGYHTAGYFFRFGHCFADPWYSGFNSFGDGLYSTLWGDGLNGGMVDLVDRPPWNYPAIAAGFLLALAPTILILAGAGNALRNLIRKPDLPWFVLTGVALATIAAIIYMGLKLPYYAQVKAFYGMIAMLPLCAFAVKGWEVVSRRSRVIASAAAVVFAVWALNSYASYWIRSGDSDTQVTLGGVFARDGYKDLAGRYYAEAYRLAPGSLKARKVWVTELARRGRLIEARQLLAGILRDTPNNAEAHAINAQFFAAENDPDGALAEAHKAVELAPDQIYAYPPLVGYLLKMGRYREAAEAGIDGLRVDPIHVNLRVDTGRAFAKAGDLTNALYHFQIAARIKPDSKEAQAELLQLSHGHAETNAPAATK